MHNKKVLPFDKPPYKVAIVMLPLIQGNYINYLNIDK